MSDTIGYFQAFNPKPGKVSDFLIVSASHWDEHQTIDGDDDIQDIAPPGFFYLGDGLFEHDYDNDKDAEVALRDAGFYPKVLD